MTKKEKTKKGLPAADYEDTTVMPTKSVLNKTVSYP